jgi:hypothetical protein
MDELVGVSGCGSEGIELRRETDFELQVAGIIVIVIVIFCIAVVAGLNVVESAHDCIGKQPLNA